MCDECWLAIWFELFAAIRLCIYSEIVSTDKMMMFDVFWTLFSFQFKFNYQIHICADQMNWNHLKMIFQNRKLGHFPFLFIAHWRDKNTSDRIEISFSNGRMRRLRTFGNRTLYAIVYFVYIHASMCESPYSMLYYFFKIKHEQTYRRSRVPGMRTIAARIYRMRFCLHLPTGEKEFSEYTSVL